MGNDEWLDLFPSFNVHNVVWDSSNHLLIVVKAWKEIYGVGRDVPWDERPFKFEAKWLHVEEFHPVMSDAWAMAGKACGGRWSEKVSYCGRILGRWGNHTFKSFTNAYIGCLNV